MSLIDVPTPLVKKPFNAALLSLWGVYDQYQARLTHGALFIALTAPQEHLARSINKALTSPFASSHGVRYVIIHPVSSTCTDVRPSIGRSGSIATRPSPRCTPLSAYRYVA